MPEEQGKILTEDDISLELKRYQAFGRRSYLQGDRGNSLPQLPRNRDDQRSQGVAIAGLVIHTLLSITCNG